MTKCSLRLDAHHSFTDRYPLTSLATILKRNRFDGSVLMGEPADFAALPEFVRGVVIPMDQVDPRRLDEYQRDPRFRGLYCPDPPPDALEELARRNLTLDLPCLGPIPRIAARFPSLRLAVVHLGNPTVGTRAGDDWDRWAQDLEAAATFPQVRVKLSGLVGLAPSPWRPRPQGHPLRPYVQHALAVFGPERLMFGSGWPASLPEHTWKESLAAFTQSIGAQPVEVREQLLGGTAARFYGIQP